MNFIIYIVSIFFAQGISFAIAGTSESKITRSAKMLGAMMLSVILSIVFIATDTIILYL